MPEGLGIPDHTLLHRIGAGSYGEVWLAFNAIGTARAVKIVDRKTFEHNEHFEREFRGLKKFEPVSRSHDGLVDILHLGRNDSAGYFYYVMELADNWNALRGWAAKGSTSDVVASDHVNPSDTLASLTRYIPHTLRAAVENGRLPVTHVLEIGVRLAEALAHLHLHGLVHRDIKPANIIFVNGRPKLADVGLVAGLDEAKSMVGTAGFIAPEGPGSPQADLFSLGKVLYEISTGRDRGDFPKLPESLRDLPDRDELVELNEIVLKACAPETKHRYASATEMRDDLELLRGGRSVRRLRRIERRLALATKLGLVLAALLAGAGSLFFAARRQSEVNARLAASNAVLAAENAWRAEEAARQLYVADMNLAMQAWEHGDAARTREILVKHGDSQGRPQGFEWRLLERLSRENDAQTLQSHRGRVWHVAFVGSSTDAVSVGSDGAARLWQGGSTAEIIARGPILHAVAASPEGQHMALGGRDNLVRLWNLAAQQFTTNRGHSEPVRALAFSPKGGWLASGGEDASICVWNVSDGTLWKRLGVGFPVESLSFSPEEFTLVAAGASPSAKLLNIRDGTTCDLPAQKSQLLTAAFSSDGRWVASAGYEGIVQLWDRDRAEAFSLSGAAPIRTLAFSPVNPWLATAGSDRVIRLWDFRNRQRVRDLRGHTDGVNAVAFSRDGRWLVSASDDGTAKLWEVEPRPGHRGLLEQPALVNGLGFSRASSQLVSVSLQEQMLRVWNPETEQVLRAIAGDSEAFWAVALPGHGQQIVTGGHDGSLRLWDSLSGSNCACVLGAHAFAIDSIAASRHGSKIATAGRDGHVRVWLVHSHRLELLHDLDCGRDPVRVVCFSPNDQRVAAGARDGRILISPPDISLIPQVLSQHGNEVRGLAFSPDGRWLVSGSAERTLLFFDLENKEEIRVPAHEAEISSVAISPDGRTLASASWDSTVKLWSMPLRQCVATLRGHSGQVIQVAFSPDGNTLASASSDGTVRLWRAAPQPSDNRRKTGPTHGNFP